MEGLGKRTEWKGRGTSDLRKQGKEEGYDPCMQDAQHPQPLSVLSTINAPFSRNLGGKG